MEQLDIERRRQGVLVQGALGKFLMVELFTMKECKGLWAAGEAVPLDLVPHEFWHEPDTEFPRFSAERLGSEF